MLFIVQIIAYGLYQAKIFIQEISPLIFNTLVFFMWMYYLLYKYYLKKTKNINRNIVVSFSLFFVTLFVFLTPLVLFGPNYIKTTEATTKRTFVAETNINMLNRGTVQLYEKKGSFIVPCETIITEGEAVKTIDDQIVDGEFLIDNPHAYISEDGKEIVVSFFFAGPIFLVPLN